MEHALKINVMHFVPLALGHRYKLLARIDSGIVDQDVYLAPFLNRSGDDRVDTGAVADINVDSDCSLTRGVKRIRNRLVCFRILVEQYKSRSMLGKKARNLLSDACAGTGDQGNLVI